MQNMSRLLGEMHIGSRAAVHFTLLQRTVHFTILQVRESRAHFTSITRFYWSCAAGRGLLSFQGHAAAGLTHAHRSGVPKRRTDRDGPGRDGTGRDGTGRDGTGRDGRRAVLARPALRFAGVEPDEVRPYHSYW